MISFVLRKQQMSIPVPIMVKDRFKPVFYNEPVDPDMAILLCYFNPCKYNRLIQNALMVKHFLDRANIPYFIAELKHTNDEYMFPPGANIFQYTSDSYMFYKENLITTMEKRIDTKYTKICILDFDIMFDNPDWYTVISNKLNVVSVTQPYTHAHYLNIGFGIAVTKTNCIDKKTTEPINYTFEHTGFVWAFDRVWFNKYNFDDRFISGMGDSIFANNITKRVNKDHASQMDIYISNIAENNDDISYDSCPLHIYHLFHSPIRNRQYWNISNIIYKKIKEYNIKNIDDIFVRRDDNILEWKPEYSSVMNVLMLTYFERREDDGI